uniref:uncharacterized protein LOC120328486 n=1 Tax=Styela clava TaxID=7725 RepID=UPI00193A3429|nr:uncharacterized protein LOC120328486 [Styela clava]
MNYTKKMILVEPHVAESLPLKDPESKNFLSNLDTEMQSILQRSDLNENEKVLFYQQALHRYQNVSKLMKKPLRVSVEKISNHVNHDNILNAFPVSQREKVKPILDTFKRSNTILWDKKGQFIHDGQVIPNTNIIDLLDDVTRVKKKPALGHDKFADTIKNLNVPGMFIINKRRYVKSEHSPLKWETL